MSELTGEAMVAPLPGSLSPYLHEAIVRLGTWMPFERVPAQLAFFTQATASMETAQRLTAGVGTALVVVETAEVERLERELPDPPEGPAVQQLGTNSATVPWTTDLRSFSGLTDPEQFGGLATMATRAGGTTRAGP